MDPSEAYREIVAIWEWLQDNAKDDPETAEEYREDLVWHLKGLADWIDKGGYIPRKVR